MRSRTEVLLVEDEPLIAAHVTQKLHQLGYRVSAVATQAEEAYLSASASHPDLILMDINLDGPVDGIEAATQIYSKLKIPIVFLTAHDDLQTLRRAQDTDPFGYVTKPATSADLSNSIEIALQQHRKQQLQKLRELWLETQLLSVGAGLIATSQDGTIRFINVEGERLLGVSKTDVVGASFCSAVPLKHMVTGKKADDLIRLAFLQREILDIGENYIVETRGENRRITGELSIAKVGEESIGLVFTFRDSTVQRQSQSPLLGLLATAREQDCSRVRIDLNGTLQTLQPTLEACLSPGSQLAVTAAGPDLPIVGNQTLVTSLLVGLIEHAQACSTKSIDFDISTAALDFERRGLDGSIARYVRLKVAYQYRGPERPTAAATHSSRNGNRPDTRLKEAAFQKTHSALASLRGMAQEIHSQGWISWNLDLPMAPDSEGAAESLFPTTVILIEPDAAVRAVLCNHLTAGNYDCLGAKNFQEARDWARNFQGQIDIVVMPETEDFSEQEALREETPNASFLLITTENSIDANRKLICDSAQQVTTIEHLFSKDALRAKLDEITTALIKSPAHLA